MVSFQYVLYEIVTMINPYDMLWERNYYDCRVFTMSFFILETYVSKPDSWCYIY